MPSPKPSSSNISAFLNEQSIKKNKFLQKIKAMYSVTILSRDLIFTEYNYLLPFLLLVSYLCKDYTSYMALS